MRIRTVRLEVKMEDVEKLPMYEVEFNDVTFTGGWMTREMAGELEAAVGRCVGYLLSKDHKYWRLCHMSVDLGEDVSDVTLIPTPMVRKSWELRRNS